MMATNGTAPCLSLVDLAPVTTNQVKAKERCGEWRFRREQVAVSLLIDSLLTTVLLSYHIIAISYHRTLIMWSCDSSNIVINPGM